MTTLITGGTGFIGAEVVRLLLDRGEQRPVVFHVSGNIQRLDEVADQVDLVRGDLTNFSHVLDVVQKVKPSVIYHLGAMLSVPSDADPASAFHVNAMGTFHILDAPSQLEQTYLHLSSILRSSSCVILLRRRTFHRKNQEKRLSSTKTGTATDDLEPYRFAQNA